MHYFGKPACRLDYGERIWLIGMHASGLEIEHEAREAAKRASGAAKTIHMGPSPALIKRRLAAKKKAAREAAKAKSSG